MKDVVSEEDEAAVDSTDEDEDVAPLLAGDEWDSDEVDGAAKTSDEVDGAAKTSDEVDGAAKTPHEVGDQADEDAMVWTEGPTSPTGVALSGTHSAAGGLYSVTPSGAHGHCAA